MSTRIENEVRKLTGKNYGKGALTVKKLLYCFRVIAKFMARAGLQSIKHCKSKHVQAFFEDLKRRGFAPSTMSNYATAMRIIAGAIGKKNIVPRTNRELGINRDDRYRPQEANCEGMRKIRELLYEKDEWQGLACDLRREFGLRLKESLLTVEGVTEQGRLVLVVRGAKGNRMRSVPVVTPGQLETLERVQLHLHHTGGKSLIPPTLTLKQGLKLASNTLYRVGARKADKTNAHLDRHSRAQALKLLGWSDADIARYLGHGREKSVHHYCH